MRCTGLFYFNFLWFFLDRKLLFGEIDFQNPLNAFSKSLSKESSKYAGLFAPNNAGLNIDTTPFLIDYHLIEILDGKKAVLDTWKDDSGKAYIWNWFGLFPDEQNNYVRVTAFFGDDQASKPVISKAVKYTGPAIEKLSLYRAYRYGWEPDKIKDTMSTGVGEVDVLAAEVDLYIQAAESDSLIWESSDPKVAAVKANKSSFGAQLTGIKSGTATITIKSRKTKECIKSFTVTVNNGMP